jgi:hypothetical protein
MVGAFALTVIAPLFLLVLAPEYVGAAQPRPLDKFDPAVIATTIIMANVIFWAIAWLRSRTIPRRAPPTAASQ